MTTIDLLGWCAAAATMLTFSMRSMVRLRLLALVSNLCFIAYGATAGLAPIFVLHLCLLPCNLLRLGQCLASRAPQAMPGPALRLDPARDWIVYRQPGIRDRRSIRRAQGGGAGRGGPGASLPRPESGRTLPEGGAGPA